MASKLSSNNIRTHIHIILNFASKNDNYIDGLVNINEHSISCPFIHEFPRLAQVRLDISEDDVLIM
jgi:hypothetical protein